MNEHFRLMLDTCIKSSSFRTGSTSYSAALSAISANTINGKVLRGHTISDGGNDAFDGWGYFTLYIEGVQYPIPLISGSNNDDVIREVSIIEDVSIEYCNREYMIVFKINNPIKKALEFCWGGNLGADSNSRDYTPPSQSNIFASLTSDTSLTGGDAPVFCMTYPKTTSYWRSSDNQLFILSTSESVSYVIVGWYWVNQTNFNNYLAELNASIMAFTVAEAVAQWNVVLKDNVPFLQGRYIGKEKFTYLYIKAELLDGGVSVSLDVGAMNNIVHFDTPQATYTFECSLGFQAFDMRNRNYNIKLEIREGNTFEEVITTKAG